MILELLARLYQTDVTVPDDTGLKSIAEKEKVVGTASEKVQKLAFLIKEQKEKVRSETLKALLNPYEKPLEELQNLADQNRLKIEQIEILESLFWQEIREEFSLIGSDSVEIGIRKGWQVVTVPQKPRTSTIIITGPSFMKDIEDVETLFGFSKGCDDPECENCHPEMSSKPH